MQYLAKIKQREIILWVEAFAFGLIILLGWLTEIFRLPHYLFSEPEITNWARPLLKTGVVMCVWAAVHVATQRLLKRLHHLEEYLRICAWCRKLEHGGEWMPLEDYFGSAFATKTSHGVCPDCSHQLAAPPRCARVGAAQQAASAGLENL